MLFFNKKILVEKQEIICRRDNNNSQYKSLVAKY